MWLFVIFHQWNNIEFFSTFPASDSQLAQTNTCYYCIIHYFWTSVATAIFFMHMLASLQTSIYPLYTVLASIYALVVNHSWKAPALLPFSIVYSRSTQLHLRHNRWWPSRVDPLPCVSLHRKSKFHRDPEVSPHDGRRRSIFQVGMDYDVAIKPRGSPTTTTPL